MIWPNGIEIPWGRRRLRSKNAAVALLHKHGWSKHPLVCFRFLGIFRDRISGFQKPCHAKHAVGCKHHRMSIHPNLCFHWEPCRHGKLHSCCSKVPAWGKEINFSVTMFKPHVARMWENQDRARCQLFFYCHRNLIEHPPWAAGEYRAWKTHWSSRPAMMLLGCLPFMPPTNNLKSTCYPPLPTVCQSIGFFGSGIFCS